MITRRDLNESDRTLLATIEDRLIVTLGTQSPQLGLISKAMTSLPFLPSFVARMSTTTLIVGAYASLCISAIPTVYESLKVS